MPRRYHKRRRHVRSGYRKRRRIGRRTYRRRYSIRRRPKMLRRFRRKFRRFRRSKRRSSKRFYLSKRKLNFKLAQLRTAVETIGQQHTVPNTLSGIECVYFMTENFDATTTQRTQVITSPLCGIEDVIKLAAWAWVNNPTSGPAGGVPGWTQDQMWGHLFIKGRDKYTLRNQSNETIRLTAYYCVGRKDTSQWPVPPSGGTPSVQMVNSIYNKLGLGWSEGGFHVSNPNALNPSMVIDEQTPFDSKYFVRHFKIYKVRQIAIQAGKIRQTYIATGWKRYTPADLTVYPNAGDTANWDARTLRYDTLKGEKFVLFKLHGNIGGVPDQTTLQKTIAQTTPSVIMKTERRYLFKHQPIVIGPNINFADTGMVNSTASIIIDADEQKGAEVDAS